MVEPIRALVTGASSGIGRAIAKSLSARGHELVLVARSREPLEELQRELQTPSEIHVADLTSLEACRALHAAVRPKGLDILVNNAGMGVYGEFSATSLDIELEQNDLNIRALHVLTKLFLSDFIAAGHGAILNVASTAAFVPGPMMAGYYASKAYVLRLSEAVYEELRRRGSPVTISILCPGPVRTDFNRRAGVGQGIRGMDSQVVADYALRMMDKRQLVIIQGFFMKLTHFGLRFLGDKLLMRMLYQIQKLKKPLE